MLHLFKFQTQEVVFFFFLVTRSLFSFIYLKTTTYVLGEATYTLLLGSLQLSHYINHLSDLIV